MSLFFSGKDRTNLLACLLRYSRERAYLISLILIRPWSFDFSRALPPGPGERASRGDGPVEGRRLILHGGFTLDKAFLVPTGL